MRSELKLGFLSFFCSKKSLRNRSKPDCVISLYYFILSLPPFCLAHMPFVLLISGPVSRSLCCFVPWPESEHLRKGTNSSFNHRQGHVTKSLTEQQILCLEKNWSPTFSQWTESIYIIFFSGCLLVILRQQVKTKKEITIKQQILQFWTKYSNICLFFQCSLFKLFILSSLKPCAYINSWNRKCVKHLIQL